MLTFYFLLALLIKHFIIDFVCQTPYQYLNKGKYGHPGGLLHSWLHILTTGFIICGFDIFYSIDHLYLFFILISEFGIHYHLDWGKVKICKHFGWTTSNSEYYWWLLGLDQFLHNLTYLIITLFYPGW